MLRLFYELQNVPDTELQQLLRTTKKQHSIDVFLLKPDGSDLFDRELIPGVLKVAEQLNRHRRRASIETPRGPMFGHNIYRDTGGPLRAVVVFEARKRPLLALLNKSIGLRLFLAVALSGLVCYALSRALTRRLKALQNAASQLAVGKLDTRIVVRESGGDETDQLARSFNSMAGQLADKIQTQKRLLSDVSHELRSPLARLRIALALAEKDPDNSSQHMQRIDLEAERLEALIAQLLSSQNEEFSSEVYIDLVSLLVELCADATFEGKHGGKQVKFSSKLPQAVIPSHADLLKRCFENILRNALKYTPDNTVIEASLERVGERYIIRIEDRGPGVESAELATIFEEFYRADDARPRETGGYGLGLSIAKRAILQHKGEVSAANTDRGLAITVSFPVYPG
ncbi:MAG: HAMP domain-containing protein [Proteobacteria bacterium]|nr:HAMP domain-containing protein [Pseudomonadota bacterium]